MKRVLTVFPLALLTTVGLAGCGGSGTKTAAATVTVTVTATPTTSAAADPSDSSTDAAGASDSSSSTSADAGPDACSLLTQAEAEKVAGTPLMKPIGAGQKAGGGFVECQYTGPTSGPTAQVEVYVGDGAKQQLHIDQDNLKHAFTTVPGIGDQCLQEEGYIFVQKNGLWASIHLVRMDDSKLHVVPLQTGMKELAARLP